MQNIKTYTLDNKINILILNDNRTDLVLSSVNVSIGSNYETSDTLGMAHICEHILFHNKFKGSDITQCLHTNSSVFNAGTSYEQTYYYILSYRENLCDSINMLYNMYIENTFTEEDLEKEKRIIIEEYYSTTNYLTLMLKSMYRYLFGQKDGDKMITIGVLNTIKNITKQDIINFKKFYIPEVTTLIFLGNIKNDLLLETLKKTFGNIKNNETIFNKLINYSPKFINEHGYFKYTFNSENSTQCVVLLGFKTFSMFNEKNIATDMIMYTLNNFILFNKLRLEKGTTYNAKSFNFCNKYYGLFIFNTSVEFKYLMVVLSTIADILKDIKKNGISDEYIKRSIKKIKMSDDINFLNFTNYHMWYNTIAVTTRDLSKFYTPEEYLKKCEKITPTIIKEIANEIFKPIEGCLEIIGPKFENAHIIAEFFLRF